MASLVELDGRGRVALGKLAGGNERYLADVEADGWDEDDAGSPYVHYAGPSWI